MIIIYDKMIIPFNSMTITKNNFEKKEKESF